MIWVVMIAGGVLTFAARYSMLGTMQQNNLPIWVKRLLNHIAITALSAIIATELIFADNQVALYDNPKIPAFIIATLVALITRNALATIATGMLTLWLISNGGFISNGFSY